MATYVKQSSSGWKIFLIIITLLALFAVGAFTYYGYQKLTHAPKNAVTYEDMAELEERLAVLDKRIAVMEGEQAFTEWWTVAKWVLIIGGVVIIALYWLKKYYEDKKKRLTINEALKLGEEELQEKFSYTTRWKYGSSMQRREGSEDRVLLLTFSRFPLIPGTTGFHSAKMYIAVLNSDWENRFLSEPGMTFVQFMQHLHDLEVIGFSVQKEEEMAGLLKLKEKGQALSNAGDLAAELGLSSQD